MSRKTHPLSDLAAGSGVDPVSDTDSHSGNWIGIIIAETAVINTLKEDDETIEAFSGFGCDSGITFYSSGLFTEVKLTSGSALMIKVP